MTRLPPLIFNTDGNWMLFFLPDRNPDDVTHQLEALVPAGVDALAGLIGIDDDVVWRGSPHSAMWGDDTEVWDPDPDVDADGNPVRKMTAGRPVLVLRHHHGSRGHSGRDLLRDVGNPLLRVVVDPATLRFNGLTRDELIDLLVDALVAATKELTGSEPSAEEIAEELVFQFEVAGDTLTLTDEDGIRHRVATPTDRHRRRAVHLGRCEAPPRRRSGAGRAGLRATQAEPAAAGAASPGRIAAQPQPIIPLPPRTGPENGSCRAARS